MCGIAGFVGAGGKQALDAMSREIQHRGPDDAGEYLDQNIGFTFRRLAIIDVSAGGHQPMWSDAKNIVIVFNGEIYNFKALRRALEQEGAHFKSNSDTEVILKLYEKKGTACFADLVGMFALALYDVRNKRLVLARDRMGEKPLYWAVKNGILSFASELRALTVSGLIEKEIDRSALEKYLLFDYVPTPSTMFANVHKLEPGTALIYEDNSTRKEVFWKPPLLRSAVDETKALKRLDEMMHASVASELVSDVPLGVFLSGGIDSSTVAWYAQQHSSQRVDTFSIGFDNADFDESVYARNVAKHLDTHHHERIVTAEDALSIVTEIPDVFSEPVADASVIPTMLLSEFARKSVTVTLGGDGADELFAGYPTFGVESFAKTYAHLPAPVKTLARDVVALLPADEGNFGLAFNLKKFTESSALDAGSRHMEWLGSFPERTRKLLLPSNSNVFEDVERYEKEFQQDDELNRLLYVYARTYLMDGVLVKVDRASMHYSLETRAPFLDRDVVEHVFSLPSDLKYRNGQSKYLLKKLMRGRLPDEILDRKKKGFGIPLAAWLKRELKPLALDLLSKDALAHHGLFNTEYVERLMQEHFEGRQDNRKPLWNLMVFQMWYNRWIQG